MNPAAEIIIPGVEIRQLVSAAIAWEYRIIPKAVAGDFIELYCDEKCNSGDLRNELEVVFDRPVRLFPAATPELNRSLVSLYRKNGSAGRMHQVLAIAAEPENFLDKLIVQAWEVKASDIHLEPFREHARVRLRIDGHLVERYSLDHSDYPALVNRIKIRANLDIAEKRLPQDGRVLFKIHDNEFDIRVSTLPTIYGEKIVMRLLSRDTGQIGLESLGFSRAQLEIYLEEIKKRQGIILISGPTGSGKTTTLYATLKILNREESNILTIEDPVEYTLEGISQVQLKDSIGLGYARALRTFLRQDPDIIMLGEIRDSDTAQMAVRTALTGHLVLSTIHTNSAWGTISRLADMGVSAYLIAGTLNMSIAQRLVRILCPKCKAGLPFDPSVLPPSFSPATLPDLVFEAAGCEHCYYTGYAGRKAVYEIITIDTALQQCIRQNTGDVSAVLAEKKIKTLSAQAWEMFIKGETTIAEVYPILMHESY